MTTAADAQLETIFSYLRAHPGAERTEVMKALKVSARLVARVEAQMEDETARRRRVRRGVFGVGIVLVGGALGLNALLTGSKEKRPDSNGRPAAVVSLETELYGALDRKDPARSAEARSQLQSQDEGLRLASLRYLLGVGERDDGLLALLDDPSARVRRASVQLLGAQDIPGLSDRLLGVVLDAQRDQAERLLALDVLEGKLARVDLPQLLPLIVDPLPAIGLRAEALLGRMLGRGPSPLPKDAPGRQAAWALLLGR